LWTFQGASGRVPQLPGRAGPEWARARNVGGAQGVGREGGRRRCRELASALLFARDHSEGPRCAHGRLLLARRGRLALFYSGGGKNEGRLRLTLSFAPYQTCMFLDILFEIRNQYKVMRKKVDRKFYFCQNPKNNFLEPQSTNPNKTRRKHFWSSRPQKTPTKLVIPYKMVPLLTYFVILLFLCCT